MGLHGLYRYSFTSLHIDDVRTSQETRLWATMAYYGDCFTSFYVDDVRTSQETCLWATTACSRDRYPYLLCISTLSRSCGALNTQ
jgi:hypothetical protein